MKTKEKLSELLFGDAETQDKIIHGESESFDKIDVAIFIMVLISLLLFSVLK
jgi:hypothetical protein